MLQHKFPACLSCRHLVYPACDPRILSHRGGNALVNHFHINASSISQTKLCPDLLIPNTEAYALRCPPMDRPAEVNGRMFRYSTAAVIVILSSANISDNDMV